MSRAGGFWEGLYARTRPAGALANLESPKTVARLVAGALWGAALFSTTFAVMFFRAGEPVAGWSNLLLTGAYLVTWVWHVVTGTVRGPTLLGVIASIATQFVNHVALGGFANSGAFHTWGITMTFVVAMMMGRRPAIFVGVFYGITSIAFAVIDSTLSAGRPPPPAGLSTTLFVAVFLGNLAMVTYVLLYFLGRLSLERERSERLLLNVLPAEVAAELKEHGQTTARRFDSISVLFADIVGFTRRSADMDPEAMVTDLNTVFSHFDNLARTYGCEKIRTIGDGYMVAAGIPVSRPDHAQALAGMALDMIAYARQSPLTFRIGINSGPAVAGVIGTSKFQYDVWGDTVNTASRMESHGVPGRIQVSQATYDLISAGFDCTLRGDIDIKGKGTLRTWFLESRKPG